MLFYRFSYVVFFTSNCFGASFWPRMDNRYCSTCLKKLCPSFFLEDALALPQSKAFATCYICREKSCLQQRKRKALADIHPNIPLTQRPAFPTLQVLFRSSETIQPLPPPVRPPLLPVQLLTLLVISTGKPTLLLTSLIAGFLLTD
jgi:hypothetical protein